VSELFDLSGRVALVTGSTHGIGRACAERLAEHGARVVFSSRSVDDCEARAEAVNRRWGADRALAVPCDVGDAEQVRELVRRTAEHWGRLDVVVGNARTEIPGTSWVERIDPATMTSALVGSATNNLVLAQEAVPHLRRQGGGSVIFIASTAGTAALEEHLAYGVAKAALIHMASILAVQLGPHNVRVNTVSPGVIAARGLDSEAWADGERARVVTGKTPLGRPGTPDEIAGCVVWLASPSGAFATGKDFVVDGGQTLKGMEGPHEFIDLLRQRHRDATPPRT
jgi:NAD(P)-dependent dehydrogenase (short-subunit alcohol dehydrogenase family)